MTASSFTSLSLRQWSTFAALFALGVILILVLDAALHGSTESMPTVAGLTTVFTLFWLGSYLIRGNYPRIASFVRYFLPLILYPTFYGAMHGMTAAARPWLIDASLREIDIAIFGTDPIAWLGTMAIPILTDLLYIFYFSYYLGMPVLLLLMWWKNSESDFRRALSAMVIGWYGALITYALFPALGPNRFFMDELPVLSGALPTTALIQDFLTSNLPATVRDCVPSMHTGVTLLTLVFAFRYQRKFFWIYLVPGLGVIMATMYIQAHYVIDVILGFCAAFVIYQSVRIFKLQ